MKRSRLGAALFAALVSLSAAAQPWGPELRVNTTTIGAQWYPSVAGISTSEYVVVWGGFEGVHGQRVNMINGSPAGAEFLVSSGDKSNPSVGTDIAGVFVVGWTANGVDSDQSAVEARRFNWSGEPLGAAFRANTYTTGVQSDSKVATFGNRRFVVVWADKLSLAHDPDVKAQLVSSTGAPDGAELRINSLTTERQQTPSVAGAHNHGFVAVWTEGISGGLFIAAQRYDPQGQHVAFLRVSDYTSGGQTSPSVASDPEGNFVAVWEDVSRDGSQQGIFGRRFSNAGVPLGPEFRVNTHTTGQQLQPAVATDQGGSFLVAWQSADPSGLGVFAQEFTPGGEPRGDEHRVNTYTSGDQRNAAVAAGYRNFVVAWDGPDAGYKGVYAQRFCFKGDVDGNGVLNVADVLYMINRLFAGGPPPFTYCPSVNGDEVLTVSDVLYMINHLFAGGPAPI